MEAKTPKFFIIQVVYLIFLVSGAAAQDIAKPELVSVSDTGTVTFLDRSSVRANGNMKTGKFLMDARNDSSHIWKMGTAIFTVDCKNRRKISLFTQSYDVNGKPLGQAMVDDFNKFGGTDIPPKSEVEKQFLALCR